MKLQKGFIVPVLLAVLAAVLIGAGTYAYLHKGSHTISNENQVTSTTTSNDDTLQASSSGDISGDSDTSGLKTYTNTQYGFSFQYSPELGSLSVEDNRIVILNNTGSKVIVNFPRPFIDDTTNKPKAFSDVVSLYNYGGYNQSVLMVGGIRSFAVSNSQIGHIILVPLAHDQILQIEADFTDPLIKQMLSRFTFAN